MITDTSQQGYELAITLSRRGVKYTQPDMDTLKKLKPASSHRYNPRTLQQDICSAPRILVLNIARIRSVP
ncbi:hypothetical protein FE845_11940 [Marinobacter sp. 1-4A]|nr:hypothetical protein [Marinobacter sp. 1-4A]